MRNEEREKVCGRESGAGGRIHAKSTYKRQTTVSLRGLWSPHTHIIPRFPSFDFTPYSRHSPPSKLLGDKLCPFVPWPQAYHNGYS